MLCLFRTSATTSSKCWYPETMTWSLSVEPMALIPCADTTGSVSADNNCILVRETRTIMIDNKC